VILEKTAAKGTTTDLVSDVVAQNLRNRKAPFLKDLIDEKAVARLSSEADHLSERKKENVPENRYDEARYSRRHYLFRCDRSLLRQQQANGESIGHKYSWGHS
jgi:hypothetical protein